MSEPRNPGRPARPRLLVITYHFPPDGSIGGLRWAGLLKYLARIGWETHVITASRQHERVSAGVIVHHVAAWPTLNDAYNRVARYARAMLSHGRSEPPVASARTVAARQNDSLAFSLRKNLAAAMGLPDYGRGWVLPAWLRAVALTRSMRFDAVVTSGPPHSAHLVGLLPGAHVVRWVDMRDPWAGILGAAWVPEYYRTWVARVGVTRLERLVFRGATRVIANTEEFATLLRRDSPALPVDYVPNGIDLELLPPPARTKYDSVTMAYAGTLYAGRNLSSVLLALREFLSTHADARGRLRLAVAGKMDPEHAARFRAEITDLGLADVVELLGEVSRDAALDIVNRSHLALVLAQNQPLQTPAKLYESMGMRVPTLVLTEPTSASAREARRVGAIACGADDVNAIRRVIEDLWKGSVAPAQNAPGFSYEHLASQVNAMLSADAAKQTTGGTTDT